MRCKIVLAVSLMLAGLGITGCQQVDETTSSAKILVDNCYYDADDSNARDINEVNRCIDLAYSIYNIESEQIKLHYIETIFLNNCDINPHSGSCIYAWDKKQIYPDFHLFCFLSAGSAIERTSSFKKYNSDLYLFLPHFSDRAVSFDEAKEKCGQLGER